MKQIFLFISFAFNLCTAHAQNEDFRTKYLEAYKHLAVAEHLRTGIPASITMAQAIIESDWGRSRLATEARNHFGIKCHKDWDTRMAVYEDDDEKNECFRKYHSHERSYVDHSSFLKTRPRYAFLFDIPQGDYKKWAKGLKTAGYATNPKYPSILIGLIERYDLAELDDMDLSELQKANPYFGSFDYLEQGDGLTVPTSTARAEPEAGSYQRVISLLNRKKYVRLREGDNIHDVAQSLGMKTEKLYKYNDLSPALSPYAGMRVFIQAKRNKGRSRYHIVAANESLWQVSQDHGIKIKKLYSRNMLPYGAEVEAGQRLNLKSTAGSPPRIRRTVGGYGGTRSLKSPVIQADHEKAPLEEGRTARPNTHLVQKGETLYSISQKYYIPIEELRSLNNLEGNNLTIGMRLKLK